MSKILGKTIFCSLVSAIIISNTIQISDISAANYYTVNYSVNTSSDKKLISPYIYGVNYDSNISDISATALKQGSNRYSTYNWENNFSNAGSDFFNTNDNSIVSGHTVQQMKTPGYAVELLLQKAKSKNISYSITTLPMCDYVAADANGPVLDDQKAPSSRWVSLFFKKNAPFSLEPDLSDNAVYIDEYINRIISTYGKSDGHNGIRGYALDNNPSDWNTKHTSVHPEKTHCKELLDKSVQLSKIIKGLDSNAMVFGGQLRGFDAYTTFSNAPDWKDYDDNFNWFIDYYLSEMKKASQTSGKRLLDVLDLHYYSENTGEGDNKNVIECTDYTHSQCNLQRMQAPRTLWDSTFTENSKVGSQFKQYTPLIPTIFASINKYYSGTKLAFSEYNFGGGGHISGGIAQADALGIFGREGVYLACLNSSEGDVKYQNAALNLYTNYDGNGSGFGNTSVKAETSNINNSSIYASVENANDNILKIILINKSTSAKQIANLSLQSSVSYNRGEVYGFNSTSSKITKKTSVTGIKNNKFSYTLEPQSVVQIVLTTNNSGNLTSTTDSISYFESMSETGLSSETSSNDNESTSETNFIESQETTFSEITEMTTNKSQSEDVFENNSKRVSPFFKVVVVALISLTILGLGYLIFEELLYKFGKK